MRPMRSVLALVIALAACGDDDFNGLPDAPVPPDTTTDGPTEGLVKLTITSGTTPVEGVKVYFQNSDSSMVAAVTTDADGVASAVMEPGGFVTAIDPFPQIPQGGAPPPILKTFAGVKPGDELVLHQRDFNPPGVLVNILANPEPDDAASSYQVFAPCLFGGVPIPNLGAGSGGVSGQVFLAGCGGTTDLTIVAFDGSSGLPTDSFTATGVALVDRGTIDLTGEVYTNPETVTFEYTGVPANIGAIDITSLLATSRGGQFTVLGGAIIDNGTGITPDIVRPVIDNALQITSSRAFGPANGRHNVLEWGPKTTAYSLAMGNVLTPSILINEIDSLPAYDLAAKTVRWTVAETDGGQQPDFIVVAADFERKAPVFERWLWDIAAPAVAPAEAVRFPVLPAPDDRFNPVVGDSFQDVDELILAKVPGGYDAIRENVFAEDDPANDIFGSGLVVGAQGQVVFEEVLFGKAKRVPQTRSDVLRPFAERLRNAHKAPRR